MYRCRDFCFFCRVHLPRPSGNGLGVSVWKKTTSFQKALNGLQGGWIGHQEAMESRNSQEVSSPGKSSAGDSHSAVIVSGNEAIETVFVTFSSGDDTKLEFRDRQACDHAAFSGDEFLTGGTIDCAEEEEISEHAGQLGAEVWRAQHYESVISGIRAILQHSADDQTSHTVDDEADFFGGFE
jgi:hypothetical protein